MPKPKSRKMGQPAQTPAKPSVPGKKRMELIASVSRSSGLEKDGDALKDFHVQEEYYGFIHDKLNEYWERYPLDDSDIKEKDLKREELRSNILILFRKLREGILSTQRSDSFALEVYENSAYLSILFHAPVQTTSILSNLLPHLRLSSPSPPPSAVPTSLISLLHYLVAAYPSQSLYHEQLHALSLAFLPHILDAYRWIGALARSLRSCNYARLDSLTRLSAFAQFVPASSDSGPHSPNLALYAMCTLVDALRVKARDTTWKIIRSAYRELSCLPTSASSPTFSPTREWLAQSLALRSVTSESTEQDVSELVDEWLARKCSDGEVRRKEGEGTEGRWIVCKVGKV